jgi:peptidoglycan/LPS O-acetylase OafA/YrhL
MSKAGVISDSMAVAGAGLSRELVLAQPANPAGYARGFIPELDGLRGLAILVVLVHHFWSGGPSLVQELARIGWMGVDVFFVLSGFLITGILLDTRGDAGYYRNFFARRALRVFPLYYLFVGACFTVLPLVEGGDYANTKFVRESGSPLWYVFYLSNVRTALVGDWPHNWVRPLWSLAIEEQFYLFFPPLVAMLSARRLRHVLWGMVGFAFLFRLATTVLMPENHLIQYTFTLSRLGPLALGGLLALAFRGGRVTWDPALVTWAMLALIGAVAALYLGAEVRRRDPAGRLFGYTLVAFASAAIVLWTVLHRGTPATRLFRAPPLRYVGKICYGLYLLHIPVESIIDRAIPRLGIDVDPGSLLLVPLKVAVAVAVAAASWHLFESRVLRAKKFFASSRHPPERPAAAATTVPASPPDRVPQ